LNYLYTNSKQLVNNFAYAYWKYYGEQNKINELSSLVDKTIQKFIIPTQNNESYMEYAKDKWGKEELFTFNNYGWFQFSSVKSAITGSANLEQALNQMCAAKVSPKKAETMKYEICDQMSEQVITDAVRLMEEWGVLLPKDIKIVFCDDVNCHMCQVENLWDGRIY